MPEKCPFSSIDYLHGLVNIGEVCKHPDAPIAVLKRKIDRTEEYDGIGPWPYRWITSESDINAFAYGFNNLVSLCVVSQPGWKPTPNLRKKINIRKLKDHFVFDPEKPAPALSKRASKRLRDADRRGEFKIVIPIEQRLKIIDFYNQLKLRRKLTGGFFDMHESHFKSITKLPGSIFFRVSDEAGTGAMACGVITHNFLQILHLVPTRYGLSWNASYLMMYGLQQYARQHGLLLLTGGMPDSGSRGLCIFKNRWANSFLPVYLLCFVNKPSVYKNLITKTRVQNNFFPPYRNAK